MSIDREEVSMKDEVLNDIKKYAISKLQAAYGFVGAAESDEMVLLNSTNDKGEDIKITFKLEQ